MEYFVDLKFVLIAIFSKKIINYESSIHKNYIVQTKGA